MAELALKRTLGREPYTYPAPTDRQPSTEQQAHPGRSLPLLAVLAGFALTVVLAAAATWGGCELIPGKRPDHPSPVGRCNHSAAPPARLLLALAHYDPTCPSLATSQRPSIWVRVPGTATRPADASGVAGCRPGGQLGRALRRQPDHSELK